jgi:AcrR family transcriptional regulator
MPASASAAVHDERPDPPKTRRVGGLDAQQRREQRKQQILDAAKELFSAQGYLGTSIEQLSQQAAVSTKSYYEVFDSREDCYVALYEQLSLRLREAMAQRVQSVPDDENEATAVLLQAFVDALAHDLPASQILLGHARLISPAVDRLRRDNRRWTADYIEALWTHFGETGDHHAIAVALVGGMFDLITNWLVHDDPPSDKTTATLVKDLNEFYNVVRRGITP